MTLLMKARQTVVFVLVQNFYIIRGLRQYGYDKEADELK